MRQSVKDVVADEGTCHLRDRRRNATRMQFTHDGLNRQH